MHKLLDFIFECIGWVRIMASPLLIGLGIGYYIYFSNPSDERLAYGITVSVLGLMCGIVLATKAYKQHGTMRFLSRLQETPDLDDVDKENRSEKK